ncbi:MAG TPA: hypothetical protein ENN38_00315 [Actinobacteria bacterium]|nr:hypothetical protein [Actinomycetota bacterium]
MVAKITKIVNGSVADKAGIRAGDILEEIDDTPLKDIIDFQVLSDGSKFKILVLRRGKKFI